jgi:hypothetical protein
VDNKLISVPMSIEKLMDVVIAANRMKSFTVLWWTTK